MKGKIKELELKRKCNMLSEQHKQATHTQNSSLKYEKAQQLYNITNHGNILEKEEEAMSEVST